MIQVSWVTSDRLGNKWIWSDEGYNKLGLEPSASDFYRVEPIFISSNNTMFLIITRIPQNNLVLFQK